MISQKVKSKKRHVLSSDDEDDIVPSTPVDKSKQKVLEIQKNINPVDVFGTEPVKQSTIKVSRPSKKNKVRIYVNMNNRMSYYILYLFDK